MSNEEADKINVELCESRLSCLYANWDKYFDSCDALLILTGKTGDDDDEVISKIVAYFMDLEGTSLSEKFRLEFLSREASLLSPELITNLVASFNKIGKSSMKIGTMLHAETLPESPAAKAFMNVIGFPQESVQKHAEFPEVEYVGVDVQLTKLILQLDDAGRSNFDRASIGAGRLAKEVVLSRVVHVLDQELKQSHSSIAMRADAAFDAQDRAAKWRTKYGLDMSLMDLHHALVESGESATLDWRSNSNDEDLFLGKGSIPVSVGVKYNSQVSWVSRTVFMDVGQAGKEAYKAALDIQTYLYKQIRPGKKYSDVYHDTRDYIQQKYPLYLPHVVPNFGGAMWNRVDIPSFMFDDTSDEIIDSNVAVVYSVKLKDLPVDALTINIALADSCLVSGDTETGDTETAATLCCVKKLEDVIFEEDEVPPPAQTKSTAKSEAANRPRELSARVRSRRAQAGISQAEAERVLSKQRDLRRAKVEEIRERYKDGGTGESRNKKDAFKLVHLVAYRDAADFPKDLRIGKICLDNLREALFVPTTGGRHMVFHVSMLRNVSLQEDEVRKCEILRIGFNVPGASSFSAGENPLPDLSTTERGLFLKELLVRSTDPRIAQTTRDIKDLMKRARMREANKREEDLEVQQALQVNRTGKRIVLRNLLVRHTGGSGRKSTGVLEAHMNGFRYIAPKSDTIDIIYSNIRHAYFQPVSNEMIILLHFHLKSAIMLGRKKIKDVQFFCEVVNQAEDLEIRRARSAYDPDELLEEQREQERKRKLNLEFKRFVESVTDYVKFEVPIRQLKFQGVCRNNSVMLMPTSSSLVNLTEWPPFILTIEDVDVVSFERVVHGLRHFDMIFIFKNYSKPVAQVATIPVESLDMIKVRIQHACLDGHPTHTNMKHTNM